MGRAVFIRSSAESPLSAGRYYGLVVAGLELVLLRLLPVPEFPGPFSSAEMTTVHTQYEVVTDVT